MDEVYVKKVLAGDAEAFRYFLKTYKDMGFSLAISILKDEFLAEEAVQLAFIKAFKSISKFQFKSTFRTWFYRILLNEAFELRRKSKREFLDFQDNYDESIADESILFNLNKEEQTYYINEALKLLPAKEALVLRLFYLEEESIKEVCQVTGWSGANVKVILHRARKNMLQAMNQLMKTK